MNIIKTLLIIVYRVNLNQRNNVEKNSKKKIAKIRKFQFFLKKQKKIFLIIREWMNAKKS